MSLENNDHDFDLVVPSARLWGCGFLLVFLFLVGSLGLFLRSCEFGQ